MSERDREQLDYAFGYYKESIFWDQANRIAFIVREAGIEVGVVDERSEEHVTFWLASELDADKFVQLIGGNLVLDRYFIGVMKSHDGRWELKVPGCYLHLIIEQFHLQEFMDRCEEWQKDNEE